MLLYRKASDDYRENQKSNVAEKGDVLDRFLMSGGLEKEKHKAKCAIFMNVIDCLLKVGIYSSLGMLYSFGESKSLI